MMDALWQRLSLIPHAWSRKIAFPFSPVMPVIETRSSMDAAVGLGTATAVSLSETHGALLIGTFFGVM